MVSLKRCRHGSYLELPAHRRQRYSRTEALSLRPSWNCRRDHRTGFVLFDSVSSVPLNALGVLTILDSLVFGRCVVWTGRLLIMDIGVDCAEDGAVLVLHRSDVGDEEFVTLLGGYCWSTSNSVSNYIRGLIWSMLLLTFPVLSVDNHIFGL